MLRSIEWKGNYLVIIDQTKLPEKLEYVELHSVSDVYDAIVEMKIRGAPLIGVAAAYGVLLGVLEGRNPYMVIEQLRKSRPTAVNLENALREMQDVIDEGGDLVEIEARAKEIEKREVEATYMIGEAGLEVVPDGARILTICNTGIFATPGIGTALGVVYKAHEAGKLEKVYSLETRPVLQGARLTVFELMENGVDVTLVVDSMAGILMSRGYVNFVIVGADRVAKNGDFANKIGTLNLAILANHFKIPFYVALPTSTIDPGIENGDYIPLEERSEDEVKKIGDKLITRPDAKAFNLAFDVTPGELVHGYITEKGILKPPF